jgi:hypothetical protein
MGKNSKTAPVPAPRGRNTALEVIDSILVLPEFRYAGEQRNFSGRSGELNGLSAEIAAESDYSHFRGYDSKCSHQLPYGRPPGR